MEGPKSIVALPENTRWEKLEATVACRFKPARFRTRLYGIVSVLCLLASLFGAHLRGKFNFILSDACSYYAYLPSIVFDHDLALSNQIRPEWRFDKGALHADNRTERGYVLNKYPIGWALTLLPSFLASEGISHLLFTATGSPLFLDDGRYSVVYQLLNPLSILSQGLP